MGGPGVEEGKDSLERLLEDMDSAASCGRLDAQKCAGCLAMEDAMACVRCAFGDAARRMRARMPHDADGREIEVGDTIESTFGTQVHVTDVIALPVNAHDGVVYQFPVSLLHLWRVVESDSWEKLEQDAQQHAAYISQKIKDCGLENHAFYFYLLPLNDAEAEKKTIMQHVLDGDVDL